MNIIRSIRKFLRREERREISHYLISNDFRVDDHHPNIGIIFYGNNTQERIWLDRYPDGTDTYEKIWNPFNDDKFKGLSHLKRLRENPDYMELFL